MLTKADIQRLRSLRDKKTREELGLFVVEGGKVIGELISAGFAFNELYATGEWVEPAPRSASSAPRTRLPIQRITTDEMARASHFPTPASVLAVGSIKRETLVPETLATGLTLALDGVQDPGNVGTLLRIADWFGLARVLLSPDCADLFNQKVINASMGSFARVPTHTVALAHALTGLGVPVLGCDLVGTAVHTLDPLRNAVIVIGSEGRGLSPDVKACISQFVTIPRIGSAESLNAGVAAAIVCDNLRRLLG